MTLEIQEANPEDFSVMLELNQSCVPHVNAIGKAEMRFFHEKACRFVKVAENGHLGGYVIALGAGVDYASLNYQWFSHRYEQFLYIDRIMVHPDFRRRGIASMLYQYLEETASRQDLSRLCCEVNLQPPNPDSLALHLGLGFVQEATQETEGGTKEVSLLVKNLLK